MKITLLGLLVVLGTFLLVVYAVKVHGENNGNNGSGSDSKVPDDPNADAWLS